MINDKAGFRAPTQREAEIITQLTSLEFQGADRLKEQLDGIGVRPCDDGDNYGSIEIKVSKGQPANTKLRVPVHGRAFDIDGATIDCLLHVEDGFLRELEFFKVDGTAIKKQPEAVDFAYEVMK